jgi:hypothetical protein
VGGTGGRPGPLPPLWRGKAERYGEGEGEGVMVVGWEAKERP